MRFLFKWLRLGQRGGKPPQLPQLEHIGDPAPGAWLRASMVTFAESVASFLPGHFEAYVRLYHPFEPDATRSGLSLRWRDLAAASRAELRDAAAAEEFALHGVEGAQAPVGRLPPALIGPLIEHLRRATRTPERCFFAVWEGVGGSIVPPTVTPALKLPHRRYHLFAGPIDAADTNFSGAFDHQSANLWWPADQAWCVATDVDFAWTYVGGTRACIGGLLTDPRLEAVETTAERAW